MQLIKKAAMFGLDARIALAIFGALSVISGAALYSAIQQSKTESYRQTFVEALKASDEYYLSTGNQIPQESFDTLYTSDLLVNREAISSWQGPYLQGERYNDRAIVLPIFKSLLADAKVLLYIQQRSAWANTTVRHNCVIDDEDCSEYIVIYSSDSDSFSTLRQMFNNLDELVDNSDGGTSGKVRLVDSGTYVIVLYQGRSRVRTS